MENEEIHETIEELKSVQNSIFSLGTTLLSNGELRPLVEPALGEGFPYDYKFYMQHSVDIKVQKLYRMMCEIDKICLLLEKDLI